ncbi:MAG: hypothetical protein PPFGHCPK_00035 [Spiroplasma endosymbiont of Drosophila atripex]|nr:MAG: hypothetical protein PPFGHCPK_00035 [Spiroplasma endosymbiont of Drosophila atripex]
MDNESVVINETSSSFWNEEVNKQFMLGQKLKKSQIWYQKNKEKKLEYSQGRVTNLTNFIQNK